MLPNLMRKTHGRGKQCVWHVASKVMHLKAELSLVVHSLELLDDWTPLDIRQIWQHMHEIGVGGTVRVRDVHCTQAIPYPLEGFGLVDSHDPTMLNIPADTDVRVAKVM